MAYGQTGYYGPGTSHKIYLSTGTGFIAGPTIANTNSEDTLVTAVVADWNNDGAQDFWLKKPSGDMEETFSYVPEEINSVTNGLGVTTTVNYAPLNQNSPFYQKCSTSGTYYCGTAYPTQNLDGPFYVVKSVNSGNGIGGTYTSTYVYRAAQADLHGRGFLGFAQVTVADSQTGIVQTTTYGQAFPFTGIILTQTKVSGSVTLNSTVNTYGQVSLGTGTDGVSRYFVELQNKIVASNDLNGSAMPTTTVTFTYDCDTDSACAGSSPTGYGNATEVAASLSDGSSKTTINTYANDTSNGHWYLNRLLTSDVLSIVPGSRLTRQTAFTYDTGLSTSTGLLTGEMIEPESSSDPTLKLETDYTYDVFGNKASAAVKGCTWVGGSCGTVARTTQSAFDATTFHGQFPTTVTNALSQQETWSYTGDTQFGGPTSHTGPNGLTTTWQYDTFGRKTLEVRPDGNRTATSFVMCTTSSCPTLPAGLTLAQLPANVQFYVEVTPENSSGSQNGPVGITFYDGLSRVIATDVEGFDSTASGCTAPAPCWIRTATQYDANGRVGQSSRPYFVSGGTAQWTVNTYDVLGRVTLATFPDSMGAWTYIYDGFGELATQIDGKNQVTTITYDALARVLTNNAGGFISTYVYDTAAGKGVGQLASATTSTSYTRTYTYDSLGRPSTITLNVDGTARAYTFGYDANGRLLTLAYPSGFTAKNAYTANGYLYQISDNAAGTVFWTANSRDAELHLLTQTQGNGVTTTQAFYAATGLIKSIVAGPGNAISNQTFNFDPLGNLTYRTWLNGSASVRENACYDGLNRVTSTLITTGTACLGSGDVTVVYDALGNITEKSDVCATANCIVHGSGGAGPHALTAIVGTYRGVTNPTFTYDANGAELQGPSMAAGYTPFNMPAWISTEQGGTLWGSFNWNQAPWSFTGESFAYDSEHKRTEMSGSASTTYYLNEASTGAMEEEVISGGTTTWNDYIVAGGKLVAERSCAGAAPCSAGPTLSYFVLDHLGSVSVIVSSTGAILNQLSYDAWGKRRNADGSAINCTAGTAPPSGVTRGFTGQEMLDGLCLVNLNARIYDPALGRFMAADPVTPTVYDPQALNRYSYVANNPLSLTDPTGHSFLSILADVVGVSLIFVGLPELEVALSVTTIPAGATGLFAAFQSLSPGLIALNAGIAGGMAGFISTGTWQGAAISAGSAAAFAGLAPGLSQDFSAEFSAARIAGAATAGRFVGNGFIGGLLSLATTHNFVSGFLASGFGSLAVGQPLSAVSVIETSILGGGASVLGGGKFLNGAFSATLAYAVGSVAQRNGPLTVDPALAGRDISIQIDSSVPTVEQGAAADKLSLAVSNINLSGLTSVDYVVLQYLNGLEVTNDPNTRTGVVFETGILKFDLAELSSYSIPYLTTVLFHDSFHLFLYHVCGASCAVGDASEWLATDYQFRAPLLNPVSGWDILATYGYLSNSSQLHAREQQPVGGGGP